MFHERSSWYFNINKVYWVPIAERHDCIDLMGLWRDAGDDGEFAVRLNRFGSREC
jgi:hypothetical protein